MAGLDGVDAGGAARASARWPGLGALAAGDRPDSTATHVGYLLASVCVRPDRAAARSTEDRGPWSIARPRGRGRGGRRDQRRGSMVTAVKRSGAPTRCLLALYALFTLAAGARSIVQLATRADEAPVAYSLSLVAAADLRPRAGSRSAGPRRGAPASRRGCSGSSSRGVATVGTLSLVEDGLVPGRVGVVRLRHRLRLRAARCCRSRACCGCVPRSRQTGPLPSRNADARARCSRRRGCW